MFKNNYIYSAEQFGQFLSTARKERGYTQEDFADIIGVSHATLSALENGKPVSSATLFKAMQFLGYMIKLEPKSTSTINKEDLVK